jgi:serine/threonine protein kinase
VVTLGKYEILEEIGRGGFAVVYKARDTTLDRLVALKVLHPQLTVDPKFVRRFQQEARTAAGFQHPHIVTIHEVGEEAGQHYLAMALVPGRTLDRQLAEGRLPVEQAVSIVEQIARVLDAIYPIPPYNTPIACSPRNNASRCPRSQYGKHSAARSSRPRRM